MAHTYGEVLEGSFDEVFKFLQGPHTAFVDVGSGFGSIVFAAAQHGCLSIGIEKYRDKFEAAQAALATQPGPVRQRTRFIEEDINDTDLGKLLEEVLCETAAGVADQSADPARDCSASEASEASVDTAAAWSAAQGELRNSEDGQVSGRTSGGSDAGGVSSSNGGSGDGGGSGGSSGGGSGRAFDSLLIFCNNVAFNQGTIHRSGTKFREVMDRFEGAGIPVTVISMMPLRELSSRHHGTIELLTTWNDSELHETHVYAAA